MANKGQSNKIGSTIISKGPVRGGGTIESRSVAVEKGRKPSKGPVRGGGGPDDSRNVSKEKKERPRKGALRDGGTATFNDSPMTKTKESPRGPLRDGHDPLKDAAE